MKQYFLRSLKYFIVLCLLFVALVWLKVTYEHLPITMGQMMQLYFSAWNGWFMAVVIVIMSATYPYFGFVTRRTVGSITADRQQIEAAMATTGLVLKSTEDGRLVFRATGVQRLTLLFEDEVIAEQQGEEIVLSGHRKSVVRAMIRLEGYLVNKRRTDE
jgi:hypothetical protein